MKKAFIKTLSTLLVTVMLVSSAPLTGFVGLELPDWLDSGKLFAVEAEAETSGTCGANLTWTLDTSTGVLEISGTGAMRDWSYESTVPWYSNRSYIKTVKIGNGVTSIGNYAFEFCYSLTSTTIPDSITSIGIRAFFFCTSLIDVTIPDSVTSIGNSAFDHCDSLTSITVDKNNKNYSSDPSGVLFNKYKTKLIQYPIGNPRTSYAIPYSVTSISYGAFNDSDSLTSITIPDSVTSIGEDAFFDCDSLTSITIPDSVTSIGDYAFAYCDNLTSITIPSSVTSIGYCAFDDCGSLSDVYYSGTEAEWNAISIDIYNGDLTNATIHFNSGNDVTDLEKTEFNGHEYSVIDKSMTWHEAKTYCESLGGHLVTITSKEENDFVFGIINESFVGDCWFGATDEKVEGTWEWVTGENFEYNDWHSGQPDNDFNGTEDYLASYYGSSWNDIRNDDLRAEKWFICEWDSENPNKDYIVQWIVDGHMIQTLSIPVGSAITSPSNPTKDGYEFAGWTPNVPETMPAQHMTFVAVWEKVGSSEDPDVPPETYEYETVVGVLKEYETSVILNGTAKWISKICIDGRWFDLYEDYAYQDKIKSYEDKQVVAVIYNGYVSTIDLLNELKTEPRIYNFDSSVPTLEYYDGVFRKYDGSRANKWYTVNGTIANPFTVNLIDASKVPASESLKFKNVSVTIKSSDKKIISLDKGLWDIESDSATIELGDIEAGKSINFSEQVLNLKTGWNFPNDQKEHSVTLYYTVTGVLNGETVTKETSETIKLINNDYSSGNSVATTSYKKQSIRELFKEMQSKVMQCDALDSTERLLVHSIISSHLVAMDVADLKNTLDAAEKVYEIARYISGIDSVTYWTAGKYVIDAIWDEVYKGDDELKEAMEACLKSLRDCEEFNTFIKWYYDQQNTKKNSNKRTDVRCPVDIYIYDEKRKLVLSIIGNEITASEGDIHAFVCEDDKIIYLPTDTDYDVKIIATGNGTMDYIITEYSSEGKLRKTVYEDIPLTVNETYNGTVTKHTMPEAESYNLTASDGTEITHDNIELVDSNISIQTDIRTPSTTTIKYGDGIILHADLSEALPAGWSIKWSASNGSFDYSVSADGTTCTITPNKSGDTVFTATVYDAEGNEVCKDEQTMTSKAGFFQKLAAFFKKIFGLTKVIQQSIYTVY